MMYKEKKSKKKERDLENVRRTRWREKGIYI